MKLFRIKQVIHAEDCQYATGSIPWTRAEQMTPNEVAAHLMLSEFYECRVCRPVSGSVVFLELERNEDERV